MQIEPVRARMATTAGRRLADYNNAGYIAFQSQGAKMYWRNIRVKVE